MSDELLVEQEKRLSGREYSGNEIAYIREVLNSGHLSSIAGGTFVPRFEQAFAELIGSSYAIATNTCMSALHAAVLCAGAGAGSEVICDAEFIFGAQAVLYNNAIPVFVDINPVTHNVNPETIEPAITERTKAIIVTHAWGLPAEMDRVIEIAKRHNLMVIEDCAEALLAKYKGKYAGNWGDVGCYSFQASKQLSTGDGGMAATSDPEIKTTIGSQAGAPTFHSVAYNLDYNYRMNELTAALGLAQLEIMPEFVEKLRKNARLYDEAVSHCPWIKLQRGPEGAHHSFYHWAATFRGDECGLSLEEFRKAVDKAQFASISVGYTNMPAYKHPLIAERRAHAFTCPENDGHSGRYGDGACPVAEDAIPRLILGYVTEPYDMAAQEADMLHQLVNDLQGQPI